MAPDCNQLWTSDGGGGEGGSVVGRLMSPNLMLGPGVAQRQLREGV